MKLPQPNILALPLTVEQREILLKSKGMSDYGFSGGTIGAAGKNYYVSSLADNVDIVAVVMEHNFYELKKYYENMLPETEVGVCGFAATHGSPLINNRSCIYFSYQNEHISREELDRLIELRCFL